MPNTFRTITTLAEGLYKDKGSKFLSFAIPVYSIEQVQEQLNTYKRKYHDARHICYAYMLGIDKDNWRANDDGEPSGNCRKTDLRTNQLL